MVTSKRSQSSSGKKHPFSSLCSLWRKANETNEILLSWERLRLYRRFTFKELRTATNNFQLTIRADAVSTVFKGYIDDDHKYPVAVRRYKSDLLSQEEFLTEIKLLSNLPHHPNIISLIGYCFDGPDHTFILYEYMSGGTIGDRLHDMKYSRPPSPWKRRLQICIGVARGLECLHTGNPLIIHRDIKSINILLNENWVAKISDFGLSKLVPANLLDPNGDLDIITEVAGTLGYLDPEYVRNGLLTLKSDLYSFGVVLFEVLSGRKYMDFAFDSTGSGMSRTEWPRGCVEDGRLDEIIDPRLRGEIAPDCLKAYGDLAYNCTNERGNERPPIAAVVKRLELALLLQECIEADIPFSPSWLKSIVPPPKMSKPEVEIQDSEISGSDYDIEELLRD